MQFLITGYNYIGTPEGFLKLESHEHIEDVYTLGSADWVYNVDKASLTTSKLYEVSASDTGFTISLVPGFKTSWPGGKTYNARCLDDSYFNGTFFSGEVTNVKDSPKCDPEILEKIWGDMWDRNTPWYERAWQCRDAGISIPA
jgi:hypothetical protein